MRIDLSTQYMCRAGSVKACYGHTEGTAGIHGALLSILTANSRAAAPIMQLRSVNPYVSAALSDWRKDSRVEPIVPRVRQWLCDYRIASALPTVAQMTKRLASCRRQFFQHRSQLGRMHLVCLNVCRRRLWWRRQRARRPASAASA